MNNQYENNLRTHYSPLRNYDNNQTNIKLYENNRYNNADNYSNICNFSNYRTTYGQNINKTPNKIVISKSIYYPNFNYHYAKKNLNLNLSEKDKLNKSFNKINPYYFQDKIQFLEKDNINSKIKNRIYLQREAMKQLALNKIKNPSEKEKLQKINEFSTNPLVSYIPKNPLHIKTMENYNYNQNLIKNNYVNLYNRPRKEIEDYYNVCQYQPPMNDFMDTNIHTKPNYIYPKYEKYKMKNKIKEELDEQRESQNDIEMIKNIEDENNGRITKKLYINYELFLKNKENDSKKDLQKEMMIDNNFLEGFKQYQKKHLHDNEQDYLKKMNKKMKEEDLQKEYEEREEQLKNMKNLREWYDFNQEINEKKKKDKNKEKILWKNYSAMFEIKCNHGNNLYKCCRCGKKYSRDQVHKIIY